MELPVITVEVRNSEREEDSTVSEPPLSLTEQTRLAFLEGDEAQEEVASGQHSDHILAAAKATARRARVRISVLFLMSGSVCWLTMNILGLSEFQDNRDLLPYRTMIMGTAHLMLLVMLLGILPGDRWLTRLAALALLGMHISIIFVQRSPRSRWQRRCDLLPLEEQRKTACAVHYYYEWTPVTILVSLLAPLATCLMLELSQAFLLERLPAFAPPAHWWHCRWLRMNSRRLLHAMWLIVQLYTVVTLLAIIIPYICLQAAASSAYLSDPWPKLVGDLYSCLVGVLVALLAMPRYRSKLQWMVLSSSPFHERGEVAAACAISALLGGVSPRDVMAAARQAFRALPVSALHVSDLEHSLSSATSATATVAEKGELYARTVPVALGSCHAFMSHSWSDARDLRGAEAKMAGIERWASDHRDKHAGQSPLIWLE